MPLCPSPVHVTHQRLPLFCFPPHLIGLACCWTSYEWNHELRILLCLASLAQRNTWDSSKYYSVSIYHRWCIHPFVNDHLSQAIIKLLWMFSHISWGNMSNHFSSVSTWNGIIGYRGSTDPAFIRNCQIGFQSGWSDTYFHPQHLRVMFLMLRVHWYCQSSYSWPLMVVSHCGFSLRFPDGWWNWVSFLFISHLEIHIWSLLLIF